MTAKSGILEGTPYAYDKTMCKQEIVYQIKLTRQQFVTTWADPLLTQVSRKQEVPTYLVAEDENQ